MVTAAYLRISKDDQGEGLGVERQLQLVQELARRKGWRVHPDWVLRENDTSAWDDSKPRKKFERLLKGMESGEVDAVVVYAFDRLARRLRDTARVLDLVDKHNVKVATVTGDLDLSSAYGRGIAGLLGSLAAMETASMSERLRAKAEQNAKAGRPMNGGSRPYGFTVNRLEIVPHEADVIRDAAKRLLAGESLTRVKNDLNAQGLVCTGGSPWRTQTLRNTLQRPALCGRVSHHGQILPGVKGVWEPILDEDTFDRLQLALAARYRTHKAWDNRRVHLLSGLLTCGLCGAPMFARRQSLKANNGARSYRCSEKPHLSRDKGGVDAWVIEQVKQKAATTEFRIDSWSTEADADVRSSIAALERRKAEAAREFADGSLPADMLKMIAADIDGRLSVLQEKLVDEAQDELTVAEFAVFQLNSLEEMELNEQRSAIEMWVTDIKVGPGKRGRGFSADGIDIEWRDLSRLKWRGVVER